MRPCRPIGKAASAPLMQALCHNGQPGPWFLCCLHKRLMEKKLCAAWTFLVCWDGGFFVPAFSKMRGVPSSHPTGGNRLGSWRGHRGPISRSTEPGGTATCRVRLPVERIRRTIYSERAIVSLLAPVAYDNPGLCRGGQGRDRGRPSLAYENRKRLSVRTPRCILWLIDYQDWE